MRRNFLLLDVIELRNEVNLVNLCVIGSNYIVNSYIEFGWFRNIDLYYIIQEMIGVVQNLFFKIIESFLSYLFLEKLKIEVN